MTAFFISGSFPEFPASAAAAKLHNYRLRRYNKHITEWQNGVNILTVLFIFSQEFVTLYIFLECTYFISEDFLQFFFRYIKE